LKKNQTSFFNRKERLIECLEYFRTVGFGRKILPSNLPKSKIFFAKRGGIKIRIKKALFILFAISNIIKYLFDLTSF
jgi:hypothetical protein